MANLRGQCPFSLEVTARAYARSLGQTVAQLLAHRFSDRPGV